MDDQWLEIRNKEKERKNKTMEMSKEELEGYLQAKNEAEGVLIDSLINKKPLPIEDNVYVKRGARGQLSLTYGFWEFPIKDPELIKLVKSHTECYMAKLN